MKGLNPSSIPVSSEADARLAEEALMLSLPSSPVKIREKFVSANPKCHESVSGSRIGKGTHLTLRDSGSEKICAHRTTHEIEGGGGIFVAHGHK